MSCTLTDGILNLLPLARGDPHFLIALLVSRSGSVLVRLNGDVVLDHEPGGEDRNA